MSPFDTRFNKFLATGDYVAAEDARPRKSGGKPDPEKFLKNLLSQHDKRFHPNGFNPETDTCTFREQLDKTNSIDDLSAAEKREATGGKPRFRKNEKVISDASKDGWRRVVVRSDEPYDDNVAMSDYKFCEIVSRASDGRYAKRPARSAVQADNGAVAAFLENPEAYVKSRGLYEFDDQYAGQVNRDVRLNPDHLAKPQGNYVPTDAEIAATLKDAIKGDYEKGGLAGKTGQTVDEFVKQFIDDAKADGFTVSDKSVDLLRQRMEGLKNTPASKAFEPRFDMNKQGLFGYGNTDPSAKDAATLASVLNTQAGWGFGNDDINAYIQAFRDMDAGKTPKLPELGGKTYEPPMDTLWSGSQKALAAIFQKRPDLIRPFIVERLEDANFAAEAKELVSGDYKKRTEPYDWEKEVEKRQHRQMAQDAAAVKYLKEC